MSTREEIVSDFYGKYDEETRLERSRRGQLEYFTTMEYIHRYAGSSSKADPSKHSTALLMFILQPDAATALPASSSQ